MPKNHLTLNESWFSSRIHELDVWIQFENNCQFEAPQVLT